MDTPTATRRANLYQTRRLKVSLREEDWKLIEYGAMDDGRSVSGEVAFLLREVLGAARRGGADKPGLIACAAYHGGITVEQR